MTMAQPALRTLPALLARNAEEDGDRAFLSDADRTLTRAEVWRRARAAASGFAALGLVPGDRVAVILDNSLEFVATWFGLATAGLVQVPLNPALRGDRLTHALEHSGARVVVADAAYVEQIEAIADRLAHLEIVLVHGEATSRVLTLRPLADALDGVDAEPPAVAFSDTAAILYTSGSTGLPKGVIVPHGQHYMNGWQAARQAELTTDDRMFVTLPLHHNMAQGYGVMPAVVAGAAVHVSPGFKRATFWDEIIAADATVFTFIGSIIALLAGQDGPADNPVRVAYGVPVPREHHEAFERRFGLRLLDGYGSTEATIPAWGSLRGERRIGSSGRVVPEFEISIVDDDDVVLPAGSVGEIAVRPREPFSMFQGYFRDPERTVVALRNLRFHTGDRGRFDTEGNLWFEGRIDDVIRRFGEFVSAKEVEDAVMSHRDVELVAAYGVASDVAGQEVMVAVVPHDGAIIDAAELRAHCGTRLPAFAVPRYVEFVAELPMTATGKVEKHKLRSRGVTTDAFDSRANKGG
jgi:carnitine-CoA ligase